MNLVGHLADPFVLHQRRRIGHVRALLVRMVKFALSIEEPLACHLGHGFNYVLGEYAPVLPKTVEVPEPLEPCVDLVSIFVLCVHRNPLCV